MKGWIPILGENGMAFLMVGIVTALVSVTWKISMPNLATAALALIVVIFSGVGLPSLPDTQDSSQLKVAAMQGVFPGQLGLPIPILAPFCLVIWNKHVVVICAEAK